MPEIVRAPLEKVRRRSRATRALLNTMLRPRKALEGAWGLRWYFRDLRRYRRMEGAERVLWRDAFPIVDDKTATYNPDVHYFYQDLWALRDIVARKPRQHVDFGSRVDTIAHISASVPTTFVDIRPLTLRVKNLDSRAGSLLDPPFPDQSLESVSCLHVAEHIGLGRYGDPLDPMGTRKACVQLARILAPGGRLYFSFPVGEPRVCFNAHRIHDPVEVPSFFPGLKLDRFHGIDDGGNFHEDADPRDFQGLAYGCGMYELVRA